MDARRAGGALRWQSRPVAPRGARQRRANVVHHDLAWFIDDLTTEEHVSVIEMHTYQLPRVEQPVVVVRQPCGFSSVTGEITYALTCAVGELRAPYAEAAVVGNRHAHHSNPSEAASFVDRLAIMVSQLCIRGKSSASFARNFCSDSFS
jgi:hypothetical protein